MIALSAGVKVWVAAGATDMRKGFGGLAALVQTQLAGDPLAVICSCSEDVLETGSRFSGGVAMGCAYSPSASNAVDSYGHKPHGTVSLTAAQLSMLLEGIDWRHPHRTTDPPHVTI